MSQAALALLSAALETTGTICTVGIKLFPNGKTEYVRQVFHKPGDFDGAVQQALKFSANGLNAYFCTSTLKDESSRLADNAQAVKVFKIDLDVGPDDENKFLNKDEAKAAIKRFCKENKLPRPVIVDSGYGFHCYWILDRALDALQGKMYATKFKVALIKLGLKMDRTVPGDIARILRVPDTMNFKHADHPKPVVLINEMVMYPTDAFCDAIDRLYDKVHPAQDQAKPLAPLFEGMELPEHLKNRQLDGVTRTLIEGKPKRFDILLKRSCDTLDRGCNQIKYAYENRATLDEPRWRAALAIATFAEDGPIAIHTLSEGGKDYSFADTVAKSESIPAPHLCSHFEENWPSECKGCPHKGKINTPLKLGEYVPRAKASANLVAGQNKEIDQAPQVYKIPEYPFPYFRSAKGGVWRSTGKTGDEGEDAEKITDLDVYLVKRLKSEEDGFMAQICVHHPTDGVIEFTMDTELFGTDDFRKIMNKYGVLAYDKAAKSMRDYITKWFETLSKTEQAATVKTQFGWTENDASFVIGEKEILPNNVTKFSPVAPSIGGVAKLMKRSGDLETWKKIINTYAMPGLEPHAFCFLVGFASPLLKFTGMAGVQINAFSQASGTGKSTTLLAAQSIWGDPVGLGMTYKDTANARVHRMGIYHNLPICVDEITKMEAKDISDMLFWGTMGRGRGRMESQNNRERVNNTSWAALTLTSANSSFAQKLQAGGQGVEGELMRLIEPQFPKQALLSKVEADKIFLPLKKNYGHAGEIFMAYVVTHLDEVKEMLAREQEQLDIDGKFEGQERFWSAAFACVLVSGKIAHKLGLHEINMDRIRVYMLELTEQMRKRIAYSVRSSSKSDLLGEYMAKFISSTLSVETKEGTATIEVNPRNYNEIHARYEKTIGEDYARLFISQAHFRKFCDSINVNMEEFLVAQEKEGTYIPNIKRGTTRLTAGTSHPTVNVKCFEFVISDEATPLFK